MSLDQAPHEPLTWGEKRHQHNREEERTAMPVENGNQDKRGKRRLRVSPRFRALLGRSRAAVAGTETRPPALSHRRTSTISPPARFWRRSGAPPRRLPSPRANIVVPPPGSIDLPALVPGPNDPPPIAQAERPARHAGRGLCERSPVRGHIQSKPGRGCKSP